MAETLEHGQLQRYVYDHLQLVYSNRYHRLIQAIHKHLTPLGTRIPQTDRETVGGYFVWITLPSPLKGSEFAQRAKEDQNVVVAKVSNRAGFPLSHVEIKHVANKIFLRAKSLR